jgi:hypothetical protein
MVFDYTMVGEDSWIDKKGSASGIFVAGNRAHSETLLFTSGNSWQLKDLLDYAKPGDEIFWLACRAWL